MTSPTTIVEVAFVNDPYGALTWTDVTSYVLGFSTTRGRNYELGVNQAGTLSMTLDNRDGRFDPTNTSSAYYPYVKPYRPIRVRATYSSVTYDVWRGFVERWPQSWEADGIYGKVSITAVDAFKTVLGATFGPRYAELQAAAPTVYGLLHADIASGSTEANAGTAGGSFTYLNTGALSYRQSSAIAGDSGYSIDLGTNGYVSGTPLFGSNAGSMSAWVKVPTILTDSSTAVIASDYNSSTSAYGSRFAIEYGATTGAARFVLRVQNGSPGVRTALTSSTAPVAGTWMHVAYSFYNNGSSTGVGKLWINGVLEATATNLGVPSGSSGSTTYVGAMLTAGTAGNFLKGQVDEVEFTTPNDAANLFTDKDVLNRYQAGTLAREAPAQKTGARVGAVLDVVSWPAGTRSISAGLSNLSATGSLSGQTALQVMQAAADAELGNVFINGAGSVVFQDRSARNSAASTVTLGDGAGEVPYRGALVVDYDDTYIYNDVIVTQAGVSPAYIVEAVDTASRTTYGLRVLTRSAALADTADVDGQAATLLAWYKDPHARIAQISVDATTPTNLPTMLGREIGDLVTVKRRPPGAPAITLACFIDGVSHDVTPSTWTTTFLLTPQYSNPTY